MKNSHWPHSTGLTKRTRGPGPAERRRLGENRRARQPPTGKALRRRAADLWSKYAATIRIGLLYAVFLSLFLVAYAIVKNSSGLSAYLGYNAAATGFLARLFGLDARVQDNVVTSGSFAARIVADCTSLAPLGIYLAGVLAFPATLRQRLVGVLLGSVVLTASNVLRTTSLLWVGIAFPQALDVAHILVWQSLTIVLAVGLWILWHRTVTEHAGA